MKIVNDSILKIVLVCLSSDCILAVRFLVLFWLTSYESYKTIHFTILCFVVSRFYQATTTIPTL
jgi:hypothetical protein